MAFHEGLALGLASVFVALALLHFYWAAGGQWALDGTLPRRSADGERLFVVGPVSSIAVAVALLAAAAVCAARVGSIDPGTPGWMARAGVWVLAAVFGLRAIGEFRYVGFFKRVRDTDFARRDTRIYSPLCAVLSAGAITLALTAP